MAQSPTRALDDLDDAPRLSFDSGRVSMMRTVSPALRRVLLVVRLHLLASASPSCRRPGARTRRSSATTTVFSILSLTTTPDARLARCARRGGLPFVVSAMSVAHAAAARACSRLAQDRLQPRDVARGSRGTAADSRAARWRAGSAGGTAPPRAPRACASSSSADMLPNLVRPCIGCQLSSRFTNLRLAPAAWPRPAPSPSWPAPRVTPSSSNMHAARLHHRHPALGIALALAHAGLGRLLRDRLVREDPDPDLAAALDVARQRHARGLDLPVGDPARLQAPAARTRRTTPCCPAVAMPLVRPLNILRNLTRFGRSIGAQAPVRVRAAATSPRPPRP